MSSPPAVVVIGGGISGLVCAYALQTAGIAVRVFEASARPGGMIRTERSEGYLCELGPQSFLLTEELLRLSGELGIEAQRLEAQAGLPRYVVIGGALHAVPMSPPALVTSSLLSFKTKIAILRDAVGHSRPPDADESVAAFVRRKFTGELLERLVGPFVSGIYAGDAETLSWRSAFPQAHEAEAASGSLIRGMIRASKSKRGGLRKLASYLDGNETLPRALAERLGEAVQYRTEAQRIDRLGSGAYRVALQEASGEQHSIEAGHVVIATPAYAASQLLAAADSEIANQLCGIEYAPVGVVALGYAQEKIGRAARGFGFLVPRGEKLRTLGTVWNSSLFAGRAPQGCALYTSFIGGATDPAGAALSEAEMIATVQRETAPLLEARGEPRFAQAHAWHRAIPQYNLGHSKRMAAIAERLRSLPGLRIIGNYLAGPSIGTCAEEATKTARQIAEAKK